MRYFPSAYVQVRLLRDLGCRLPVELWYVGPGEMDAEMRSLVEPLGVRCVDACEVLNRFLARTVRGWPLKAYALLHSAFREVLLLDADNCPVVDPTYLFGEREYLKHGAAFWPDGGEIGPGERIWQLTGVPYRPGPAVESGQLLVDKARCWPAAWLAGWMNERGDYWYRHIYGDKDTFPLAWRKLGFDFAMPSRGIEFIPRTLCQHDFAGARVFQHRVGDKWLADGRNCRIAGFAHQELCLGYQADLLRLWRGRPNRPRDHAAADEATRAAAEALCAGRWDYHRDGRGHELRFALVGTIDGGPTPAERHWHLRVGPFGSTLAITGVRGVSCLLARDGDGWSGRWRVAPKRGVRLNRAAA